MTDTGALEVGGIRMLTADGSWRMGVGGGLDGWARGTSRKLSYCRSYTTRLKPVNDSFC